MADPSAPSWAASAPSTTPAWAATSDSGAPSWASGGPLAQPDWSKYRPVNQDIQTAAPHTSQLISGKPADDWGNALRGMAGSFEQAVSNGLVMQPVRAAMEGLGIGMDKVKALYPGQSEDWYRTALHNAYTQSVTDVRQNAYQQTANNPYPGHQVGNTAAAILGSADPTWAINPGGVAVKGLGLGGRIALNTGTHAAFGSAANAAAQVMDIAEGQKKDFDVQQNLEAAALQGTFGAAHTTVSPFVKNLFKNRGVDTTPADTPSGIITPITGDHIPINGADAAKYHELLQTGSVDDIKGFFKGRNGPQPNWQDVNTWVQHRDNVVQGAPVFDQMKPDFDYAAEYNAKDAAAEAETHRQSVEDHIGSVTKDWKNAPNVEVVHHPNDISDPDIRQQALAEDPKGDALGFLGADGKVRIFSGRVHDPETANALIYHEALGHYGLAEQFGDKLDSTLGTLMSRNVGQFGRKVDAWMEANPGAYGGDRTRAAEEVLAEASQNGQIKPSWQDALTSHVRAFGRKMGLNLSYSDAEVNHVLAMAHDAVINGKPNDVAANGYRGTGDQPVTQNKFMTKSQYPAPEDDVNYNQRKVEENPAAGTRQVRYMTPDEYHSTVNRPPPYGRPVEKLADDIQQNGLKQMPWIKYDSEGNVVEQEGRHRVEALKSLGYDQVPVVEHKPLESDIKFMRSASGNFDVNKYTDDETGQSSLKVTPTDGLVPGRPALRGMSGLHAWQDPQGSWHVGTSSLPEELQGKGLGREAYRLAQDEAHKEGQPFVSDSSVSERAARLWESAGAERNPSAKLVKYPEGSAWETPDNSPVYTGGKFMKRSQLAASSDYKAEDLEGIYRALDKDYVPQTRSWDEDRRAALAAGFKPSQIKDLKETNPGDLSTRLWRMQAAANMADSKIAELNARLDTPDWSMKDQQTYLQTLADRNYLVTRIKGEKSEIARALNVSKAASSYTNKTMADVAEMLRNQGSGLATLADDPEAFLRFARQVKNMMNSGNPQGAGALMAGVNKPYWEQYLNTFHMNMMLSALSTHVKAPIDMATGIARDVIERTLAIPVGKLREGIVNAFGGTAKPGIHPMEVGANLFGIMKSVTDAEVYRRMAIAVKTGEGSYVAPDGTVVPSNIASTFGGSVNPRIPGVSIPTDLISAQDTFFRSVAMNQNLYSLGARRAANELGPKASWDDIMTLGSSYARTPSEAMLKEATDLANRTLLLNENPLNKVINKYRIYGPNLTPWDRVARFVVSNLAPFIRVESNNLINRVIQRSPLGFLDPWTQKQIAMGGAHADLALTRIAYGTALIGMAWTAADKTKDYLQGEGPDNIDKFKEQEAGGWSPKSVHEDGRYNTPALGMSVNPFDKHNTTATMVASMREAYDKGANQGQVGNGIKLALGSMLHDLAGESWLQDITPGIDAATARGTSAGQRVNQFVGDEAKSWMPNGLGQVARMMDPVKHDVIDPNSMGQTVVNSLKTQIPGATQSLPTRYSVYGDPMQNGTSLTGVHTVIPGQPGNGTTETTDPTEKELQRLSSLVPKAIITPVTSTVNGQKLTKAQFEEYQRLAGHAIVEQTRTAMADPDWQKMSDAEKIAAVRGIQIDMKRAAKEALYGP